MAVIGARPARSPWFVPGGTGPRRRTRPQPARRGRRGRATRRFESRLDVRPLLVVIAVAAALALFYLSQSTRVAATGYEIDALESLLADRRAEQQQLTLSIGEARSPSGITRRARTELRLVQLDQSVVRYAPEADDAD